MTILLSILVVLMTLVLRQVIYHRRKIPASATIEKIKLSIIKPNLITPEVEIFFKYPFGGGIYTGRGYVSLKDFHLSGDARIFYNEENIPILEDGDGIYGDEEHIEAYLLGYYNLVSLNIDPIEPYRFEILHLDSESANTRNKI